MNLIKKVSVIGLGKLGLPTATFFASHGCNIVGVDLDRRLINDLNTSVITSTEPGLRDLFMNNHEHFHATDSISAAVSASDMTFIVVPTPSLPSGEFSTEFVRNTAYDIGYALKDVSSWHLVVLVSTVLPGMTREHLVRVIEEKSGKVCGKEFGVCYNPEFIALGNVLHNLSHPDFELIGQSDEYSGSYLQSFYADILGPEVPVARMSLENAELVKVSINTFVTTKISYANMLAEICEHVPGLDIAVVTGAIGLDRRIGIRYLNGGLGFGGPCFPRDNQALSAFAARVGAKAMIADATDRINDTQVERLVNRLLSACGGRITDKSFAVLGLSYKQDTEVIEKSQALGIAQKLITLGAGAIVVFDQPNTIKAAQSVLGNRVLYASSVEKAVADADVVIVAVADKKLVPNHGHLKNGGNGIIMVDPWRVVDMSLMGNGVLYYTVGKD